jgi:hypothetical protein
MIVKVSDYGEKEGDNFVEYMVLGLSPDQLNFLDENLIEETEVNGNTLMLKMHFDDELYPFQSEAAKFRLDDFIVREEIEMNIFLSSFLEDMG